MTREVLRLIGYWDGRWAEPGWPDVRGFVAAEPDQTEQAAVAAYLRSGTMWVAMGGVSLCRFCGDENGCTELTDGRNFVWPEGLAHYVERHDVRLPAEVVAVTMRGAAAPVDVAEFNRKRFETGEVSVDEQWWRLLR